MNVSVTVSARFVKLETISLLGLLLHVFELCRIAVVKLLTVTLVVFQKYQKCQKYQVVMTIVRGANCIMAHLIKFIVGQATILKY